MLLAPLLLAAVALAEQASETQLNDFRGRYKRQGTVVGRSCTQNPECGTGSYCDSTKRCTCLSTYTNINSYCWLKINPDQGGCSRNEQCSAVWPDAYCSSGTCKCGNNQPSAETRDGRICVNYGYCPINGAYTKARATDGTVTSCLAAQALDITCLETYDCICSESTCTQNGFCCPTRAMACIMDVDTGSAGSGGYGYVTRWYHNPVTGSCESFQYRGSGGNANNFQTEDQCKSYCQQACERGNPLYTAPTTPGQKGAITYCSGSSSTVCGNTNYECYTIEGGSTSMCCPTVAYVCSQNGGIGYAIIGLPTTMYDPGIQSGTSSSTDQRWYYDTGLNRCATFTYLGQGGNYNNFLSEAHCSAYCAKSLCTAGEPLKDLSGIRNLNCGTNTCPGTHTCNNNVCCPTKQTVCSKPESAGTCTSWAKKWWYNAATGNCEEFLYSGCQGNDNRFDTYSECQSFCRDLTIEPQCVQGTARKDSNGNFIVCSGTSTTVTQCPANYQCYYDGNTWGCCPRKAYTCSLPSNSGTTCGGPVVSRWYFNQANSRCETYDYNGCDGNSNDFGTQADCEDYCGVGGCPDGGTPYRQGNGQFLPCGTNSNTCPNNYYCTSVKIGTSTTIYQYCCANRAAVCRLPRAEGVACTSTAITRWYFNRVSRNCEQFSFKGCTGNRNNFATRAQCLAYCNSADCPSGQVALADATTNVLTTCIVGSTCPTTGYSCVQSTLFGTGICCGSTANPDTCPTGMSAYIDSFTNSPRTCQANIDLDCPAAYICWYAARYGQYYCCGTPGESLCPNGGTPWINPASNQAQVCTPGNNAICLTGGADNTCQARTVTVNGVLSVTGTCCNPSSSSVCGTGYSTVLLNNTAVHCHPVTANICQAPATCRPGVANPNQYFCCNGTGVLPNNQVCGTGRTPYTISGNPVICATGTASLNCPSPYQCVLYATSNTFYCCSGSGNVGGCPSGSTMLLQNGVTVRCSPNTGCQAGYYCQYSTVGGGYVCCSYAAAPTAAPTFLTVPPTQPTLAPNANPCSGGLQPLRSATGQPVACSTPSSCLAGYLCLSTTTGNWCCGTGVIVTPAPTAATIAPAGDLYGCPIGRSYLYPTTTLPLLCSVTGSCPPTYTCRTSTRYPGERQCCSLTKQLLALNDNTLGD